MKIYKLVLVTFILSTILRCTTKSKSDLQFVYSVDKEGVYLYSLSDRTTKLLYPTDRVFINSYFSFLNDSILQVGHQSVMRSGKKERKVYSKYLYRAEGDSVFVTDSPPFIVSENYDYVSDSIYYLNIKTGRMYISGIKDFIDYEHKRLEIKTKEFDRNGNIISEHDTSFAEGGTIGSSKGICFSHTTKHFGERYYAESNNVDGKTIVTERGDLILKEGNSTKILLKFDGVFDPKFGSGYYNPTLSNDGKKTSFQYLAGFLCSNGCVYEMDIKTKSKEKLVGDGFFYPLYSPDNKLLLLFANQRQSKGGTWIKDIYIFDVNTKNKEKVGQGENYLWVPINKIIFTLHK